jgi:hypothetical protein
VSKKQREREVEKVPGKRGKTEVSNERRRDTEFFDQIHPVLAKQKGRERGRRRGKLKKNKPF